jgi:hypothetical protein
MRNTVPLQIFIARASLNPDTNGDRSDMLHLLGQNDQTVGENFAMNVALLFNHDFFPNRLRKEFRPLSIVTYRADTRE